MRKLLLLIIGMVLVNPAFADLLSVRLSGGSFKYAVSGTVRDSNVVADTVDVKNDLGWKDSTTGMGYLYIEHPIPVIPDIRLGYTSLNIGGENTITKNFTYNGVTYSASDKVTSNIDLSHTEIALYYQLIDTGIDLDLGLNFKIFSGKVSFKDTLGNKASSNLNVTVPMLYGALGVPLGGGFKLLGDISTISYNNDNFTDYLVRVRYDTNYALGVELGYRSIHIKYEDTGKNEYAKLDVKGPYIMARLSF